MFCFISFIFIFSVVAQLEADSITLGQALFYGVYGLLMFYYSSKPYWNYDESKNKKNRRQ